MATDAGAGKAKIQALLDSNYDEQLDPHYIYPVTKAKAVYMSDGTTTVEEKLNVIDETAIASSGVWSAFVNTSTATRTVTFTTKKGTKLTIYISNGGTTMYVTSGASNIYLAKYTFSWRYSSAITSNYGMNGLATNTNNWYSVYGGFNNGGVLSFSGGSVSTGSNVFCDLTGVANGGNKIATTGSCILRRAGAGGAGWYSRTEMHSGGTTTGINCANEVTAVDINTIPTVYQRAATDSTVLGVYAVLEVFEAN